MGDDCVVEADVFRDGHEVIRAAVKWRRTRNVTFNDAPMIPVGNDRWRGRFPLGENTRYVFTIEAWTDRYASWAQDFVKKAIAGRDVTSDLLEGIRLLQETAVRTAAHCVRRWKRRWQRLVNASLSARRTLRIFLARRKSMPWLLSTAYGLKRTVTRHYWKLSLIDHAPALVHGTRFSRVRLERSGSRELCAVPSAISLIFETSALKWCT